MKFFASFVLILSLACSNSFANSGKEFTTSVIYGTLAGTLVGAASLAFTSSPADNLGNVARGASYGLYAGILLGLYVASGSDDGRHSGNRDEQPAPGGGDYLPPGQNQGPPSDAPPEGDSSNPQGLFKLKINKDLPLYGFSVYPLVNFQNRRGDRADLGIGTTVLHLEF
jgi:hypothetical protein